MPSLEHQKQQVIDDVCLSIANQFTHDQPQLRQNLARLYYQESIPKELVLYRQEDMVGALDCLWRLIYERQADQDKVRIYGPNYEEHGWENNHTIIDIVADNRPFLISSISSALATLGHTVHKTTHPVVAIKRDDKGQINHISAFSGDPEEPQLEAVMRFEIDRLHTDADVAAVQTSIQGVLQDVRLVVDDWRVMQDKMHSVIERIDSQDLAIDEETKSEQLAFLKWAVENHFTFIGYRYYALEKQGNDVLIVPDADSGLGTFRASNSTEEHLQASVLNEYLVNLAMRPRLLVITKSTSQSTVHRPVNFDYLGVKEFDDAGNIVGEHRFFGLYASAAYMARVQDIPFLRSKARMIQQGIQVLPASHKGKALMHILNSYPRDEMLQTPVEELIPIIKGIMETQERHHLRLFLRTDLYGRYVSALIYVPRERFHTQLRKQFEDMLLKEFQANSSDFSVSFDELSMARVHITVHGQALHTKNCDQDAMEARMREAMLNWNDHLLNAMQEQLGEIEGRRLWCQYETAFPLAYQEDHSARIAVKDTQRLQQLSNDQPLGTYLFQSVKHNKQRLNFKVYGLGQSKALSDVLPTLEHMGVQVLSARPYTIQPDDHQPMWLIDFSIQLDDELLQDLDSIKHSFQDAFAQAYQGRIASDRFNALVLNSGINWREVELLRAMSAYLHQIQVPFSPSSMRATLNKHASISRLLIDLFYARFDPTKQDIDIQQRLTLDINAALDKVTNLNEDRIIKYFLYCIQATLRCNYFQLNEQQQSPDYLAFKIDPSQIPGMPLPLPKFEIFVYSAWVEGVHLRAGKVARGGLRWSDRHEDYRTEVLGLVKAQMVKNAVIVPLGAKGGFVCKQLPENAGREAQMAEVVRSYSTFIQALIDLTDNIIDQEVVPPANTVRYDEDDPYLVVAADKGTATFSDIANGISEANNFWLGDAFASGGANGYDHKKMGITARGGWESVKRLFAERGIDCQSQDFTAIGVGDMAGDVFGNGMLLSKHICLQAAFNHMHIFVDPQPDAASSYAERQRLFLLPRSSWADYNAELISNGGGIFERAAKSIPLSAEMQAMLNTKETAMAPNDLIQALLKMPVDLFWNGGIGTYVKASHESHTDIGDPANDALRVNGAELGASIVGEGGNLGCSQAGRIEFAQHGGLINTDAIDNSGGVDSSDHEVNIKILLSQVVSNGDMTLKQRNTLLASMTDEVADLVLSHNYHQSLVLSIAHHSAPGNLHQHKVLIHHFENLGRLNRQLEGLPSDAQIDDRQRQQQGLTRPEIAVLLAYSKMYLYDELMAANIADDKYLSNALNDYFPQPLRTDFKGPLETHPLRAEIIATHVTNLIGNRMGATFLHEMEDLTGAKAGDIARAFMAACHILQAQTLWQQLDEVTLSLDYSQAVGLHEHIQSLLEDMVVWLLHNHAGSCIDSMISLYGNAMEDYASSLVEQLPKAAKQRLKKRQKGLLAGGLNAETSQQLAQLEFVYFGLDIARAAHLHQHPVSQASQMWFALYDQFQADWLCLSISALPGNDAWQRKARTSLKKELEASLASLTGKVLQCNCLADWRQQEATSLARLDRLYTELQQEGELDLAKLSVAIAEIARI